jgi:predicted DNA-binding protein
MTTIGIRISMYEKERLRAIAAQNDLTVSQIIRNLIKNFLKENTI